MKLYPENFDVSVEFAFTDKNNDPITVTGVTAVLNDGEDDLVHDFGAVVFDGNADLVTVLVPAQFNLLGVGELSTVRILRVTLTTAAGDIVKSFAYIVEAETRLEVMSNSFVTLEAAQALVRDMPNLHGWNRADDEARAAAMINAYGRLTRIRLGFITPAANNVLSDVDTIILPDAWSTITKTEFLGYPAEFRNALRQAQVCEANAILADNPIEQRHRAGIISETVGESSIMLRGGRLELGVSAETLRYLTGFVRYSFKVARA